MLFAHEVVGYACKVKLLTFKYCRFHHQTAQLITLERKFHNSYLYVQHLTLEVPNWTVSLVHCHTLCQNIVNRITSYFASPFQSIVLLWHCDTFELPVPINKEIVYLFADDTTSFITSDTEHVHSHKLSFNMKKSNYIILSNIRKKIPESSNKTTALISQAACLPLNLPLMHYKLFPSIHLLFKEKLLHNIIT